MYKRDFYAVKILWKIWKSLKSLFLIFSPEWKIIFSVYREQDLELSILITKEIADLQDEVPFAVKGFILGCGMRSNRGNGVTLCRIFYSEYLPVQLKSN